jgi:hypothetical protein
MDFSPAVGRPQPIAFRDGRVQDTLLETDVGGPLDERVPGEMAQPSDGLVGVFRFFFGEKRKDQQKNQHISE